MQTDMATLAKADWNKLESDVVTRIRFLRIAAKKLEANEVTDKVANELILPALTLLAEFCGCVSWTVSEETDGE